MYSEPPFFSIIIPTYNRGPELRRALKCLQRQTFPSWEAIVIDDGGDDDSKDVVTEIDDQRVKYFWKQNEERSIARNLGSQEARGGYQLFLDADDVLRRHYLQRAKSAIENAGFPEFIYSGKILYRANEGIRYRTAAPKKEHLLNELIVGNPLGIASCFVRRDLAREVSFPRSSRAVYGEDWCYWLRIACRVEPKSFSDIGYVYCLNSKSSIMNLDAIKFASSYDLLFEELCDDQKVREKIGKRQFKFLLSFQKLGVAQQVLYHRPDRRDLVRSFMKRALLCYPWIIFTKRFLICVRDLARVSARKNTA